MLKLTLNDLGIGLSNYSQIWQKNIYEEHCLKISPDSSGYAAEALAIAAWLAAFERIAGQV